jgi:hypothetical protein
MGLYQSAVSTQFVQVQVIASQDGPAYNPTADTVQMAFMQVQYVPLDPGPDDWQPAEWVTEGATYWAAILVGPADGGYALAPGSYYVWVKVTDDPSVPALQGPVLNITGQGGGSPGGGGGTWVQSFNGRTGQVVPEAGDYDAAMVTGAAQVGGDLGGTAAAPQVEKIQGTAVEEPTGSATQYLNAQGNWTTPAGGGGGGSANVYDSGPIGDGTSLLLTVTHDLGNPAPVVQVYDVGGADPVLVSCGVTSLGADSVQLSFAVAPPSGGIECVVVG